VDALAIICAGTLAACGGDDPSKQLDAAVSWRETMRLAATEHRAGAIPTTYSVQLADEARQKLAELRRSLPAAQPTPDPRRTAAALDSLDRAIRALDLETGQ